MIYSLCEYTNCWLQSSSAASAPNQEQQEMASSCTWEVPGKEPFAPPEGRCRALTPSAVSMQREQQCLPLAAPGAVSGVSRQLGLF